MPQAPPRRRRGNRVVHRLPHGIGTLRAGAIHISAGVFKRRGNRYCMLLEGLDSPLDLLLRVVAADKTLLDLFAQLAFW